MSVTVLDEQDAGQQDDVIHIRGVAPLELLERDSEGDDRPRATGFPVVFNEWTEIRSFFEGNFMERIAPGAVKKTIKDMGDRCKVLFQHGRDMYIGNKPLGPHDVLREQGDEGVYAEVPLIDTDYNRETLLPGLRAGLYGWSFRFEMVRYEDHEDPEASEYNPKGLMERTIRELRMPEISVVTFPQYAGATLSMRSLSDDFLKDELFRRFVEHDPERLRSLLSGEERPEPNGTTHLPPEQVEERRVEGPPDPDGDREEEVPTTVRVSRSLMLPSPLPKRGGVLPNTTTEEEGPCRPLRLP